MVIDSEYTKEKIIKGLKEGRRLCCWYSYELKENSSFSIKDDELVNFLVRNGELIAIPMYKHSGVIGYEYCLPEKKDII